MSFGISLDQQWRLTGDLDLEANSWKVYSGTTQIRQFNGSNPKVVALNQRQMNEFLGNIEYQKQLYRVRIIAKGISKTLISPTTQWKIVADGVNINCRVYPDNGIRPSRRQGFAYEVYLEAL